MGPNQTLSRYSSDKIDKVPEFTELLLKYIVDALAGVAQWIEYWPLNQRVAGLIPSQGTRFGCRPRPQLEAQKRQPHIDVFLPFFLPPFPSLWK